MELAIIGALAGYGYYYNQVAKNTPIVNKEEPKNIFESKRALRVQQDEWRLGDKTFDEPNRIIPGPPKIENKSPQFNKVDYQNKQLPLEFNDYRGDLYSEVVTQNLPNPPINQYNTNSPISGGWHGISLNGEPIDSNNFKFNNMVPFFGGSVKQNMDDKANQTILENFTGNINYYEEKKELGPLFQPETNVSNPYGMASTTSFRQNRFVPSKTMNNVSPIEQVRVGPGLNQGYTAQPSGGFQQINTRDYVLPKTVDELRVKTNPKLTYYGRILSGTHIGRTGKVGKMTKHKPDSFYINTPDRWFTTTGQQTGERQRPNVILKSTHRRKTNRKTRFGPSAPVNGTSENVRPKFATCRRTNLPGGRILPAVASGKWNGSKDGLHDYGKGRIKLGINNRIKTGKCKHVINYKGDTKVPVRVDQNAKNTKKQETIHNNHRGHIDGKDIGYVKDPNDMAKTTMKETTIDNNHLGHIETNDVGYVKDPNDVAKTTTKQTTLSEQPLSNLYQDKGGGYKIKNVEAPTTMKETTLHEYIGGMNGNEDGGYKINKMEVPTTMRQLLTTAYDGIAGSVVSRMLNKYWHVENSTTRSNRECVAKGRKPNRLGPVQFNSQINATTKKLGDIHNKYLDERGLAPTKVYNSIPRMQKCNLTKDRKYLAENVIQDRIDPVLLDAFNNNPLTQSLSSCS